jgi:hypothetical protein
MAGAENDLFQLWWAILTLQLFYQTAEILHLIFGF